jgi:hypothetical protein
MLTLTTNWDNIDALKIAIAANESGQKLDLVQESGGGMLPCLADEKSGLKLFVSNAACSYLHEGPGVLKKKSVNAVDCKRVFIFHFSHFLKNARATAYLLTLVLYKKLFERTRRRKLRSNFRRSGSEFIILQMHL